MEEYTPNNSENNITETPELDTQVTEKKKVDKKLLYLILICVAGALFIASIVMLLINFYGGKKRDYSEFKNDVPTTSVTENQLPPNPRNFDALKEKHPDAHAWIEIPGVEEFCDDWPLLASEPIDYPIMRSNPDEPDDNFYIKHDEYGNPFEAGSIYIQRHNSVLFDDPNTVIYGHNMGNGTMFSQLKKFRDEQFFKDHKTIYIYTPGHILEYEVISAFVYDNRHILNAFEFSIEEERMEFFNMCLNPTSTTKNVREGATLTKDDKIITLSTCVPSGDKNYRYLVIGKLIKDTPTA